MEYRETRTKYMNTWKRMVGWALLMAVCLALTFVFERVIDRAAAQPGTSVFGGNGGGSGTLGSNYIANSSGSGTNTTFYSLITLATNTGGPSILQFNDYQELQFGSSGVGNSGMAIYYNPAHSGEPEVQFGGQCSVSLIYGQDQQGKAVLQLGGEGGVDGHVYVPADVLPASTRPLGYSALFSLAAPYWNGSVVQSSRVAYGQIFERGEALDTNGVASSFQRQFYSGTNFNPTTNQSPGTVAGATIMGDGFKINGKQLLSIGTNNPSTTYTISMDNASVQEVVMQTNLTVSLTATNIHVPTNTAVVQEINFYPGIYNRTISLPTNFSYYQMGVPIAAPTTVYAGSVLKLQIEQEVGTISNFHANVSLPFYPPLDPSASNYLVRAQVYTTNGAPMAYNANSFFWNIKNAGLWATNKIVDAFPAMGGTTNAVVQSLRGTYTGLLGGGYKVVAGGIQFDGTSAYFNSTIAPSSAISSQNSMALGFNLFATNANLTNGQYFAGVTDGGAGHTAAITTDTAGMYPYGLNNNNVDNPVFPTSAGWTGTYVVNRTGSTAQIIYQNYSNTRTSTTTATTGLTGGTGGVYFGAEGFNNGGSSTPLAYCSSTLNNFLVAQNFTDTDVSNWTYFSAAFSANVTALPVITNNTVTVSGSVVINGNTTVNSTLSANTIIIGAPTNTPSFTLVATNFISGQVYNNLTGRPLFVNASVNWTTAAVSGSAAMQLRVTGTGASTNSVGEATSPAQTFTAPFTNTLSGFVPAGGTFVFTNVSSGSGNSAVMLSGSGQYMVY